MGALTALSRTVDRVLLAVATVVLAVMAVHITADVIARAFNQQVVGTLETVSYYHMVIAVLLPLAFVERTQENIRVDVFAQLLPKSAQLILYVFACLIGLGFFGALTWQSFLDAWQSTARQETIMSNFLFYIWPSRWALPLAFGAVCLATFTNMLKAIVERRAL
ncbi:MAG: TRAP transporter small permease subunit [Pseudomonadota bacterium]